MVTLEYANTYNTARENDKWSDLDPGAAMALLQDAEDYIRTAYSPIRTDLSADEQRVFDGLVCRLAATFQTNPPQVASTQTVKKESKEGAGFKKETEYNAAAPDPYPYITVVVQPLRRIITPYGFYMGVVTG